MSRGHIIGWPHCVAVYNCVVASVVLGWLFVAASLAALIALLIAGFWRRCPAFLALLALQAWQGAAVNLTPALMSREWWLNRWVPVEHALLVCAVLAALEILWRVTRELESVERWGLRIGLPLICVAPAYFMLRPETVEPLSAFLRIREGAWTALALGMVMLVVFLLVKPIALPRWLHYHLWLLTALMIAHAFIAPMLRMTKQEWIKEQAAFRTIAAACCLVWAFYVPRKPTAASVVPPESR